VPVGRIRHMSPPVDPEASPGGTSADGPDVRRDWATASIDRVVDAVERLRSVTTQPAITVIRTVVHGVFVAFCAIGALILVGIGLFRLLDIVIPGESWSAHLVLGASLCAIGTWFWSRRTP